MKKIHEQEMKNFYVILKSSFYKNMFRAVINSMERSVGLFVEVVDDSGELTYRVNFRLGGGMYYGWLLTEMIKESEAIESLTWICEKDFPDEIKRHILYLMSKNNLIEEDMIDVIMEQKTQNTQQCRRRKHVIDEDD